MNLYRKIPKIDVILENETIKKLINLYGKFIVKKFIDKNILKLKKDISEKNIKNIDENSVVIDICNQVRKEVEEYFSPKLKKVINATGIVLHTNFGRAPLSEEVLENVRKVACGYSNLEFDLTKGKRGLRYNNIATYLKDLTNCEDALVVNNNAAAVLLSLSALSKDREVIVSRGELIEIGGAFRIPEVMEQSGAILREVGSTNKTHLNDYKNAINENTALLLKAHTSNFRIIGFTESVSIEELVKLGKEKNIPVMFDLGSGSLVDLSKIGLPDEPTVQSIVAKGVDIVTFSGDKLLGGPQAGIILGKKKYIEILKKHPLNRALRIDKFTLASLESVIKCYFNDKDIFENILSLKLINENIVNLEKKAKKIKRMLSKNKNLNIKLKYDVSYVGGGAFPMNQIDTVVLTIEHNTLSTAEFDRRLRASEPPVVGRVKNDIFMLDVRTILNNEVKELINVFSNIE